MFTTAYLVVLCETKRTLCSPCHRQMLDRRSNPQVLREEHRRFWNWDCRDLSSHQSHTTWARIRQHFSVDQGGNFVGEIHDVVMAWHVLDAQVFSAVSNEHVALVFDEIRIGSVIQCSKLFDELVGHVDAFHHGVTSDDSSVE